MAKHTIVTSLDSTYFANNKITIGTQKPTSGTWTKGDLVISSNVTSNIYGWLCTATGTPGTWLVLKNFQELTGDITTHNHDTRYYTKTKIDELMKNISAAEHNHDTRYYTKELIQQNYYDKDYLDQALSGISATGHKHSWSEITNKPTTFAPIVGENSNQAFRGDWGKIAYNHATSTHAPTNAQKNSDITKAEIENKLVGTISTHNHDNKYLTTTSLNSLLAGYAPLNHNHDGLYYTKTQIDEKIVVSRNRKIHAVDSDPGAVGAGHIWIKTS